MRSRLAINTVYGGIKLVDHNPRNVTTLVKHYWHNFRKVAFVGAGNMV